MKKLAILCSLVCLATLLPQPRAEAQSAQFQFTPLGTLNNNAPGTTIQFSINLIFTAGGSITNVQGLTFFLQQNGAGPYVFTITGRDNEPGGNPAQASPFNDEISTNAQIFANNPQLNPTNGRDLGALADNPLGSGTYFIANITLTLAGNTPYPFSYTIQTTTTGPKTSVINDSDGNTFPIQPGSLTITTIPEPTSIALMLLAGSGLLAHRVWRGRRPSDRS